MDNNSRQACSFDRMFYYIDPQEQIQIKDVKLSQEYVKAYYDLTAEEEAPYSMNTTAWD